MISRRSLLITGGASVLVFGGGAVALNAMSNIDTVREPWRAAEAGFGDVRLNALAYAILAPSPHNRQPWQIQLDGDDAMILYCDLNRLLPETDPPNRQITIGLGAFLELLRQASAEQGYRAEIDPFPDGEPYPTLDERPVAHIRLVKDETILTDPLFGMALSRRTNRERFDLSRPVSADLHREISTLAGPGSPSHPSHLFFTTDPVETEWLREVCFQAWHVELRNPATHEESAALTRIGAAQIKANPDGISLAGTMIEIARMGGVMTQENMKDPAATAFKETQKFYNGLIETAPSFAWLVSDENSRTDQLATGAHWVRIHLAATQLGIAMQPFSHPLQEFPEMADLYTEIYDGLDVTAPSTIQGLFRFGYAPTPKPSPRWPLTSRLIR